MNKIVTTLKYVFLMLLSALVIFPILYMVINSFMSPLEFEKLYTAMDNNKYLSFKIFPNTFSMMGYYGVFFRQPDYLIKFWNSIFMGLTIIFGQIVVSVMGAFALVRYTFKYKKIIIFSLIVLMMMPAQVLIVPNYIILEKMGLIGSRLSIILPSIFSPIGTILLYQSIKTIPSEIIDAIELDGANTFHTFIYLILPICKNIIIGLSLITFIDVWNMVDQPLVFLDSSQYPLSVFLASVNVSDTSLSFTTGVLALIPVLLLFLFFKDELIQGFEHQSLI